MGGGGGGGLKREPDCFFFGGGGGGAEACYPGKIRVLVTLRYRKVDLILTNSVLSAMFLQLETAMVAKQQWC